ncbi:MAG: rubrerythrin family protein [Holophagaceae bacterium]|nr:rubrerythrin family protein [Holophagaceae bacterium]
MRLITIPVLAILASVPSTLPAAAPTTAKSTLENLQTAFNGESNAHATYLAYSEKAKTEGYKKVASLFAAAARAEEIHAANHAKIIRSMGAEPKADVKKPQVASSRENLQAALKGESYERDTMYPDFLAKARKDGNADAIQTLNLAKNAEIEHAKLYKQALAEFEGWKGASAGFYVCPVCGWTSMTLPAERCPSSFTPKSRFQTIA